MRRVEPRPRNRPWFRRLTDPGSLRFPEADGDDGQVDVDAPRQGHGPGRGHVDENGDPEARAGGHGSLQVIQPLVQVIEPGGDTVEQEGPVHPEASPAAGPEWLEPVEPRLYGKALAFSRFRMTLARLTALGTLAAGGFYLYWRLSTLDGTGALGLAFLGAEIANFVAIVMTAYLFWSARWRTGPVAPPAGTLDVFITVCGEPVDMVERTLRAALAIDYPHQTYLLNDGRLAEVDGWEEVDRLAERYGVTCFTRAEGPPGKAGNLNHAMDMTTGEFVATIDADHRARPDFAHETLGYFRQREPDDEDGHGQGVGLVCTPQQFKGDGPDLLNNRELLFYGYMQAAKDADNAAHSCGNATIYRRSALDRIGGFSTWGVVEDLHTSYRLHAAGWKSVYHPRPLTVGLGPSTASALAKQRLRWATDSLRILLWDSPLWKRGLTLRQRLHYLHTTGYYLIACSQLLFLMSPVLFLVWHLPLLRVPTAHQYLVHTAPYFGLLILMLCLYGGVRGAIRALQAPMFLAPVFVLAVFRALSRNLTSHSVTEKARNSRFSPLLLPQIAVAGLLAVAVILAVRRNTVGDVIAAGWALWMLFALTGYLTAMSARRLVVLLLRLPLRLLLAMVVFGLVAPMVSKVSPLGRPLTSSPPYTAPAAAKPRPFLALAPPASGAYLGFFDPELLSSPNPVRRWRARTGAHPTIVHWYQQWRSGERRFRMDWVENASRQGSIPMITWEPWAKPVDGVHDADQPDVSLARIASGQYDHYIRSWARGAAKYRWPILIRFMHEMNGNWYPWAVASNGNTPEEYIQAWRHVHDLFEQEGAANVSWVWSVVGFLGLTGDNRDVSSYYPGDRYVDWVSTTGFNWGTVAFWNRWHPFDDVFEETYDALKAFGKPVMISEVGTVGVGGDPAAWVRDALARLRNGYPLVKAVVWFDATYPNGVDFRLRGAVAKALDAGSNRSTLWSITPRLIPAGGAGGGRGSPQAGS